MSASEHEDVKRAAAQTGAVSIHSVGWGKRLLTLGVESRGILPVPPEERTDRQFFKIFFIWFSANWNILSFSAGTLGPVVFGLGVRDTCLAILFFNLLCALPPAYLSTWGPKLGLRQMVQARFSFGYFGVILPCIFNLIGMTGFCILDCILGGQALAAVADNNLSWAVGIVIISIISLLISFCGYKLLNWYERIAWFPVLVAFLVALGVNGSHLQNTPSTPPATASTILSFGSTVAGFVITYSALGSDFTIYYDPSVPSWRIFFYSYVGFLLPIITLQCLGAAAASTAPTIPTWQAGYENGNVGGLLSAMLSPTGNFGKFLTVLLSLSVAGNVAATFYSFCFNIQVFVPVFALVPRYVLSILATAIVIPLAIVGSHRFYDTLVNFLSLIGYWASAYVAVVVLEHLVFQKNDTGMYDLTAWNSPRRLPWGLGALGACLLSVAVIVPCIDQAWYVGPIAKTTGDIGFEVAFAVTGILYIPLRRLEIKLSGY